MRHLQPFGRRFIYFATSLKDANRGVRIFRTRLRRGVRLRRQSSEGVYFRDRK